MTTILINPTEDEKQSAGIERAADLFGHGLETKLYRICEGGESWYWNQFNDCCCDQAFMKGSAIPVTLPDSAFARDFMKLMYTSGVWVEQFSPFTISLFRHGCDMVFGQGIIRLTDGTLLVAEGTD